MLWTAGIIALGCVCVVYGTNDKTRHPWIERALLAAASALTIALIVYR